MIKKLLIIGLSASALASEINFEPVAYPSSDSAKQDIISSKKISIDTNISTIDYHIIARSGDSIGNGIFGEVQDIKGKRLFISDANDFSSLHYIDGQHFMITHFESVPAAMYLTKLTQDENGILTAIDTKSIDFSSVGGLWIPCAGSVSPWGTHLGSEEYEPDTSLVYSSIPMIDYFNGDRSKINLYNYGWIPEVKILNKNGDTYITKHYTMGRFSHELAYVLPDNKTVYMSDDGTNVGLFMFIASTPKDLSKGNLYIAKYDQIGEKGQLEWVNLGYATDKEIKKAIDQNIKFHDIFERVASKGNSCPTGFSSINTTFGHECLKLKTGMEIIASRLESRRYGALLGGTSEFRKLEGITYNSDTNELYLSISEINKGMLDHSLYDSGSNNDIKLIQNDCGAVYTLNFKKESKIDSHYVAGTMSPLIKGVPSNSKYNSCDLNNIANPDNISYIPYSNTLIIGEDSTTGHQNDAIWSYDIKKNKLTRILTTPYGSETTSVYYYANFSGFSYIMVTVQHPYGESDKDKYKNENEKRAYTGYFGALPLIKK